MNYLNIQNNVIQKYNVVVVKDSQCWRRMHAHCKDGSRRICKWKQANSYAATFDLLHEIGHIETHKNNMKRCESESEATRWAIAKLKEYDLPLKRVVMKRYKAYILMTYNRGIRRGLSKRIKTKLYM